MGLVPVGSRSFGPDDDGRTTDDDDGRTRTTTTTTDDGRRRRTTRGRGGVEGGSVGLGVYCNQIHLMYFSKNKKCFAKSKNSCPQRDNK